jgi:hypothetical protein
LNANTIDWSSTAATNSWSTGTNWINNQAPADSTLASGDFARFNQTSYTSQPSAGTRGVYGVIVGDGTTNTAALAVTTTNLSLGAGGITVNANAGPATIGKLTVTADQTWTNNSSNAVTLSGANAINSTVTISGSGGFSYTGINAFTAGIVFATSGSTVNLTAANSGAGGLTVDGSILAMAPGRCCAGAGVFSLHAGV